MKHTVALAVAAALTSMSCHAFVYCGSEAKWKELRQAQDMNRKVMHDRRFAELDRHFSSILAAYEKGAISDAEVDVEFGMFGNARAQNETLHAAWVEAFPRSRASRLAHAYYWTARGYAARGGDLADKTSEVQFAAMEQAFRNAWAELDAAEKLAKTPLPEWSKRLHILRATGGSRKGVIAEVYRKALAMQPKSILIRTAYANAAAPQWGGSFEALREIREGARSLPAADRRFVEARIDAEMAHAYQMNEQTKQAIEAYERAMRACPTYGEASNALLRIHTDAKDYAALISVASFMLEHYPDWAWAYSSRAWAYQNLKKYEEAFRDYERAAQLGNWPSYEWLAYMTEWGRGTRQDYQKAVDYYMIAHSKGVKGTKEKADKIRAVLGIQ